MNKVKPPMLNRFPGIAAIERIRLGDKSFDRLHDYICRALYKWDSGRDEVRQTLASIRESFDGLYRETYPGDVPLTDEGTAFGLGILLTEYVRMRDPGDKYGMQYPLAGFTYNQLGYESMIKAEKAGELTQFFFPVGVTRDQYHKIMITAHEVLTKEPPSITSESRKDILTSHIRADLSVALPLN
jgi:hypothetical protein